MCDYARVSDVQSGSRVRVSGFTCIPDGTVCEVKATADGDLYFECDAGRHLLDGQVDFNAGTTYVGLFPVQVASAA